MGKKARRKAPQRYRPPPQKSATNDPDQPPAAPDAGNESPQEEQLNNVIAEPEPDPKLPDDDQLKCRHLKRGLDLEKLDDKLSSFSATSLVCPSCKKSPKALSGKKKKQLRRRKQDPDSSSLWICLACGNVGCARQDNDEVEEDHLRLAFSNGHALEHSRRQRHPLALQCGDSLSIWCFECNSTIACQEDLVNGLEALGPRGEILQQAVRVIQGSFFRKSSPRVGKNFEERGEALHPGKNGVVRGLVNLGNTCFFNSVMQNLMAIRRLKDHFLRPVTENEGPLTSALRRFYREFNGELNDQKLRERNTYNPKGLFGAVCTISSRFSGHQQQDSHELLRYLLDGMHIEEERSRRLEAGDGRQPVELRTFVDEFFGGEFASTVRCCECGYSSSVLEPFLDLSLPIPMPDGGSSSAAPSKRELKGKKLLKKRSALVSRVPPESGRKPAPSASTTTAAAVVNESFWMDYVTEEFVDVSLAEPEPELLQVTVAAAAEPQVSDVAGVEAAQASGETIDASTTNSQQHPGTEGTSPGPPVEASSTAAAQERAGDAVTMQISKDELERVLGELLPLNASGSESTLISDPEQKPEAAPGGEAEPLPSSFEVDEALCSAPPVIALPYWGNEAGWEATGWEIVPSETSGAAAAAAAAESETEGIAGLFHEEEPVVFGCANRDGIGPEQPEPEEIVEKSFVPMTLEGCLLAFTKPESLSGDNAWKCINCAKHATGGEAEESLAAPDDDEEEVVASNFPPEEGSEKAQKKKNKKKKRSDKAGVPRNATKSVVIRKAPPVLTVHLKRFAQDIRGKLSKLTGHVAFEELLNLTQFQGPKSESEAESCVYRLVGVVEHSGTLRGGHYVAFVRVEGREENKESTSFWYSISDSSVSQTKLEKVLRSEAYLLFYERV